MKQHGLNEQAGDVCVAKVIYIFLSALRLRPTVLRTYSRPWRSERRSLAHGHRVLD